MAALVGCSGYYPENPPNEANFLWPTCLPEEEATASAPTSPTATEFGGALATTRYNAALHSGPTNAYNAITWGGAAGGTCTTAPCGYVRGSRVDTTDGDFIADHVLLQPSGAGDFGSAALGVDVADERDDGDRTYRYLAAGDELVVGDPDPVTGTGSDVGRIHWFHVEFKGVLNDTLGVWDKYQWVEGGTFVPSGLSAGAGFGTAIAAPATGLGAQPSWIAVSAPGESKVFILSVNPAWTPVTSGPDTLSPFTVISTITPSSLSLGSLPNFGKSLHVADLNGDGHPELVIGAPGNSTTRGQVIVLRGRSTSPFVHTTNFSTLTSPISAGPSTPDEFGAALTAGFLATGHTRRLLAIGAPGHNSEDGAVCWLGYTAATANLVIDNTNFPHTCRENPFPQTGTDQQRFGAALAAADFVVMDTSGDKESSEADVEELAVGTPSGRGCEIRSTTSTSIPTDVLWTDYSAVLYEYVDVATVQPGNVTVFRGSPSGPRIMLPPGSGGNTIEYFHAAHLVPSGGAASDLYGVPLAVGNLQQNDFFDIMLGVTGKGDGEYRVTRAHAANGLSGGMTGEYLTEDSLPQTQVFRVLDHSNGRASFYADTFAIELRENGTGAFCPVDSFTGEATTSIYSPWVEIDESDDLSNPVPFTLALPADIGVSGMTIDGEIAFDDPDFVITFDTEPDVNGSDPWSGATCLVRGSPFRLEFESGLGCE
jgi:hypothetical protein